MDVVTFSGTLHNNVTYYCTKFSYPFTDTIMSFLALQKFFSYLNDACIEKKRNEKKRKSIKHAPFSCTVALLSADSSHAGRTVVEQMRYRHYFFYCLEGVNLKKPLQYTANITLALCKDLHKWHANTKLLKNLE